MINYGSFTGFSLLNCSSESDHIGCRVAGAGIGIIAHIEASEIQNSQSFAIEVDSANVTIVDCYMEPNRQGNPTSISLNAVNGANVLLQNSVGYVQVDSRSTILAENSYLNAFGWLQTPTRIGRLTDNNEWTPEKWGPPNVPSAKSGAFYPKGFRYIDQLGVEWVCTTPGISGNAAFIAHYGRIIRPLTFSDLMNGNLLWFPHEDMVVSKVSFVVTQTFVPASNIQDLSLTTFLNEELDDLIVVNSTTTPNLQQLTAGTVLTGTTNPHPHARLAPSGKEMFMKGSVLNLAPSAGSHIRVFTHPSPNAWTAGEGYLVIEGYYLKYD